MTFLKHVLTFCLIAGAIFTTGLTAAVDNPLVIEGVPLRITVYDDSTMHVENNLCGGDQYNVNSKGSILLLYDCKLRKWGGGHNTFVLYNDVDPLHFTPVSNTQVDPFTISTVYLAGTSNDVQVTQIVSYTNGAPFYKIVWEIVNNGSKTYTDLRFRHGGDTRFRGDNLSIGNWDPVWRMVYLTEPGSPGFMGLYGALGAYGDTPCPADNFSEYLPANVESYMKSRFYLNNIWRDVEHDAAYALEWLKDSLAPGESWTVTAFERWDCGTASGGRPEVIPGRGEGCGETIPVSFEVRNWGTAEDTYDLTINSQSGWAFTLQGNNPITIGPGGNATVIVDLDIPANATADDVLTLTATSQSDPTLNASGDADITSNCACNEGNKALITALVDTASGETRDSFVMGDEMTIEWSTAGVPPVWQTGHVRLSLWTSVNGQPGVQVGRLEPDNIDLLDGQFTWTINQLFDSKTNSMIFVEPGAYFLKIREKERGCYDYSDAEFTIGECRTGEKALITTPNNGETFNLGDVITVRWTADDVPPGDPERIRLTLWSYDNGEPGVQIGQLAESLDNRAEGLNVRLEEYTWTVNQVFDSTTNSMIDVAEGTYFIKIREKDRGCYDYSDAPITINSSDICTEGNKALIDYPNGGETFNLGETITIHWATLGVPPQWQTGHVRLSIWTVVNGQPGVQVGRLEPDNIPVMNGQHTWTISQLYDSTTNSMIDVAPGTYFLKIREKERKCHDYSDATFTINDPGSGGICIEGEKALIDYPNSGETFSLGETITIHWSTTGVPPEWQTGHVRLSLWTVVNGQPGVQVGRLEPDNIPVMNGQHTWTITQLYDSTINSMIDVAPGTYFLKIREKERKCYDYSDAPIIIE